MKKLAAIAAAVGLALFSLTGCAQSGVKTSAEATPENPMVLTLAHGLSETHTVHIACLLYTSALWQKLFIKDRLLPICLAVHIFIIKIFLLNVSRNVLRNFTVIPTA